MRPVQLIVTMFFALVAVFSWWVSDARAGVAAWRTQPGRENGEASSAATSERVTEGTRARFERELDSSQPTSGHGSSALVFPSRSIILAGFCTGLGLVVIVAVAVSVKQPSSNKKVSPRRSQREFTARTWVELTESPQF